MKRFLWFLFGFIFAIVLLIGLPVGVAYYGYSQVKIKDIQSIIGQEYVTTDTGKNMTIKEMIADVSKQYGDNESFSIAYLAERYGIEKLPEKYDPLWDIDIKGVATSSAPVNALLSCITVTDIVEMASLNASGMIANITNGLGDWTIADVTTNYSSIPLGMILGVKPEASAINPTLKTAYVGYDDTETEEGTAATLRKICYTEDADGDYVAYVRPEPTEYPRVYIKLSDLDKTVNTNRYSYELVDDAYEYILIEDADLEAEDNYMKVGGGYITVGDAVNYHALYSTGTKYEALTIGGIMGGDVLTTLMSNLTVGDIANLMGASGDNALLDSLSDVTLVDLMSDEDAVTQALKLADLFGLEPSSDLIESIVFKEADSATLETLEDDDTVYYKENGVYVATTKGEATASPLYLSNTVYDLTSNSSFFTDIMDSLEVASLMGDVDDTMMKALLFDEYTPAVGDKAWYDNGGTMTKVTITEENKTSYTYYKALTLSELGNIDVNAISVVEIIGDISGNAMLNSLLYSEVDDNSDLSVGDTVYYKASGVYTKVKYSSYYESYRLYTAVKVGDMSTAITENIKTVDLKDIIEVDAESNKILQSLAYKEIASASLVANDDYYYINNNTYTAFTYDGTASSIPAGATTIYQARKVNEMNDAMNDLALTDVLGTPTTAQVYLSEGDTNYYYTGIWAALVSTNGTGNDGKADASNAAYIAGIKANEIDQKVESATNINNLTLGLLERMQGENFLKDKVGKATYRQQSIAGIVSGLA